MFLFVVMLFIMFIPVVASGQPGPDMHIALQTRDLSGKSSADTGEQPSLMQASGEALTADYSFNVGTKITIIAWQSSSDPPPSGVTMLFQRSEDGVTWCTYYTGVTGPDGYAYLYGYTETCPGIVYYRATDIHGLGSANVFSINWLQTDPPMTCVPIPRCVDKSYSMTMIQKPGLPFIGVGDLRPWGTMVHDVVQSNLGYDGWANVFYHTEEQVTKADFAVTDSGNPNLNDASLHYHMGHGHEDWLTGSHHSWIPLSGWPIGDTFLDHHDVYKKWSDKNKWVFLDSCSVLIDKQWGGALTTSHGILGYSSYKWTSENLPRIFFENAMTGDRPITQSYYIATKEAQTGPLATVIFDTPYQLFFDHLPGHGDIVEDEDPDDNIVYYAEWSSWSGGSGAGGRQQGSSVQAALIQSAIGNVTLNTTLPAPQPELPLLAATVNPGDIIRSWSPDLMTEQHNVTSEADAPQVAMNIIQAEGGLPQGAVLSYVNTTYLQGYNTETGETFNSSPLLTSVQYRREIDGRPVRGRGGIIDVTLGEDGKNLGLLKVWRTATVEGIQKIITPETALEKLRNGDLLEIPQEGLNVTVNDIRLGFFEKGADEQQDFFEPVWIFSGDLDSGDSIDFYVYARKFTNFTAAPLTGSTGDVIAFTDISETTTIRWLWDFGDGTNSTLKNPTHAYVTGGNYTVKLTTWNNVGSDSLSRTEYITIYPDPKPVALFASNYSWENMMPPVTVAFNDTSQGTITSWYWDFGDGTNSTERNVTHVFSLLPHTVHREFAVRLMVKDQFGRTSGYEDYIMIYKGYDPKFTADPVTGTAPLAVTFTDLTEDPEEALGRQWDFGDGQTEFHWEHPYPMTIEHVYTDEGTYNVTLDYWGPFEDHFSTIKEYYITVQKLTDPPVTDFTANTTSGKVPLTVAFTDRSSGSPTGWSWDFGDSSSAAEKNPVHTYGAPGTYSVALTATNAIGSNSTTKVDYITVLPPEFPVAEFTANPTTGTAPLDVQFADQSTGSPVSWHWTFGDGATAIEQTPLHVYTTPGTYSVSLEVTNLDGSNTKTKTDYITVLPVITTVHANVRIEPETLNLDSRGTFSAFITLPEGYDVEDIDLATIVCEGAQAKSGHATGDGSGMFIAKFDREDLTGIVPGDEVTFTVTGKIITDGSAVDFTGSDTIRVIESGK